MRLRMVLQQKPRKKTLKNKLDKISGEIKRAIGRCQKCGSYQQLQWCHVYSRKLLSVRWDLKNTFCLCTSCHSKFHDRPTELTEWVKKILGEDEYWALTRRANTPKNWTIEELQNLYNRYMEIKNGILT
jgi:5-methylcytosine-specific restriction endonuclease McrA